MNINLEFIVKKVKTVVTKVNINQKVKKTKQAILGVKDVIFQKLHLNRLFKI